MIYFQNNKFPRVFNSARGNARFLSLVVRLYKKQMLGDEWQYTMKYVCSCCLSQKAIRSVHAMVWPVVPFAAIEKQFLWIEMKVNIQQTLIAPCNIIFVFSIECEYFVNKIGFSHSRQIHEHYARVKSQSAVVRMPGKSVIPAHVFHFVFWRQCS